MRVLTRLLGGALALAVLSAGAGCGGKKLVKVQGKVTLDGAPLEGAGVTFLPEKVNAPVAMGITGSDGGFRLTTYDSGDGALPGDYTVTVTKSEAEGGPRQTSSAPTDPKAAAKDVYLKAIKKAKLMTPEKKKNLLHPNYSDRTKTGLRCRVPHDGPVIFELTSSGN